MLSRPVVSEVSSLFSSFNWNVCGDIIGFVVTKLVGDTVIDFLFPLFSYNNFNADVSLIFLRPTNFLDLFFAFLMKGSKLISMREGTMR